MKKKLDNLPRRIIVSFKIENKMIIFYIFATVTIAANKVLPFSLCPINCICQTYNFECHGRNLTTILANFSRTLSHANLFLSNVEKINGRAFINFKHLILLTITAPRLYHIDDLAFSGLKLRLLTISKAKLVEINGQLLSGLKTLEYLNINRNRGLKEINRFAFSGLKRLQKLKIHTTGIHSINEYIFKGLPELTNLYLDMNSIRTIHKDSFLSLSKLKVLNLQMNNIKTLPPKIFHSFKQLERLSLGGNHLSLFDSSTLSNLQTLKSLTLDDNLLSSTSFDADILTGLPNLKHLSLQNNQITRLTANFSRNIRNSHKLSTLYLQNNSMTDIDENSFAGLYNLKILDISNNQVKELYGRTFSSLFHLTKLQLSENKIEKIHRSAFKNLTSLSSLFLERNEISELMGDVFSNLINIRSLKISENPLSELHGDVFRGMPNLVELALRNCQLSSLKDDQFIGLKNLFSLKLSKNSIKYLPVKVFLNQEKLVWLHLDNNHITNLPKNIFENLTNLEKLNLRNNNIQSHHETTFQGLVNLKELDLSQNNLSFFHKDSFADMNKLSLLNISANRFQRLPRQVLFEILHARNYTLYSNFKQKKFELDVRLNPIRCSHFLIKLLKNFIFVTMHIDCTLNGHRINDTDLAEDILTNQWEISESILHNNNSEKELITKVRKLGKQYKLVFDFKCQQNDTMLNIMLIQSDQGKDVIRLQVKRQVFEVRHHVNKDVLVHAQANINNLRWWNTVEITQRKQKNGYEVVYVINGVMIYSKKILDVNEWHNVVIYSKYNLNQTFPVLISDFQLYVIRHTKDKVEYNLNTNLLLAALFIFVIIAAIKLLVQKRGRNIHIIKLAYIRKLIAITTENDTEKVILEIGITTLNFYVNYRYLFELHETFM